MGASSHRTFVLPCVWETWISDWCTWRRAAEHRPETIRLGAYWIRRLALMVEIPPELVTLDDLVRFLAGGDWRAETRKCGRTSLRSFFGWATRTGRLPTDPSVDLPKISVPRATTRRVSEQATERVCATRDQRVRLAAILAGRMGLRRAEIAAASREDITDGRLLVHGKGGHERKVKVHPAAVPLLPTSGPLIPSLHTGGHLTPGHVGKLLSSELGSDGTAHQLRHRFATIAYRRTRDLRSVQAVLGHQNLATTQRYIDTNEDGEDGAVLAA